MFVKEKQETRKVKNGEWRAEKGLAEKVSLSLPLLSSFVDERAQQQ
jgi:hypothetical protein